jgi:hypothetical protein
MRACVGVGWVLHELRLSIAWLLIREFAGTGAGQQVSGEDDRWRREVKAVVRGGAREPSSFSRKVTGMARHVQVGVERNGEDGFVCPCVYVQRNLAVDGQTHGTRRQLVA